MAKVFRIIDRFKITGRGTVYTIKNNPDMNLHLEDILFDLQGHRFKIKGFEMIRRLILDTPLEKKNGSLDDEHRTKDLIIIYDLLMEFFVLNICYRMIIYQIKFHIREEMLYVKEKHHPEGFFNNLSWMDDA